MNRTIPQEHIEPAQEILKKIDQDIYLSIEERNYFFNLYYKYLANPQVNSRGEQIPLEHLVLKAKTCGSCFKTARTTLKNVITQMLGNEE